MADIQTEPFYILSLDGGGSLGVYTLGVLQRVEELVGIPLCQKFNLIYGTSTGSIIGCLLALGHDVKSISQIYSDNIPKIMDALNSSQRNKALKKCADKLFKESKFNNETFCLRDEPYHINHKEFDRTLVGVVTTCLENENPRPKIFKSDERMFIGGKGKPGFGCTISDAVVASCSASPLFTRHTILTGDLKNQEFMDGGFAANNPTLFTITDAIEALEIPKEKIKVLSIGVGNYPYSPTSWKEKLIRITPIASALELFEDTLAVNKNTIDGLRQILFRDVSVVRISEALPNKNYATNLLESNPKKLQRIQNFGSSYFDTVEKREKVENLLF